MTWFELIRHWYFAGYWSDTNVNNAVRKGWITQQQAHEIMGVHGIVPADGELGEAIIEETAKATRKATKKAASE